MIQLQTNFTRFFIAALCASALSACTESMDDLNKYIVSIKERPADPIEPIPPVKTYTPYEYSRLTGRDPFHASLSEGSEVAKSSKGTGPKPDFDRPKQYLEKYELDTLSMVGTFSKESSDWALVRDPEGVVHRVPVGDYMGRNYGRVVAITNTEVDLSELVPDGSGGWLVREASIALGEE